MTEENNHDKYIVCSNCKCKYINDEEHISTDFGYTRLEERYLTCVKCRAKQNFIGRLIMKTINNKDKSTAINTVKSINNK